MSNPFNGELEYTRPIHHMKHDYDGCMPYQWVRETVQNCMDAKATKIEFGIEWQAVEKFGKYRRTIADNGESMSPDKLISYICKVGEGSKEIGGEHDNFGVGLKISLYMWNPNGVAVLAYQKGVGYMVKIYFDPKEGNYKLEKFTLSDGSPSFVQPLDKKAKDKDGIDWSTVAPEWVRQNKGTVLVLLGSDENPDTVLGDVTKGENNRRGIQYTLSARYWDLSGLNIRTFDLPSQKVNWPKSHKEYLQQARAQGMRRSVPDASYYANFKWHKGDSLKKGYFYIDQGRILVEWYLWCWDGVNNETKGYVAVRYGNELFDVKASKFSHRPFGISDQKLKDKITLIFEPQKSNGVWGVMPHKSRSSLRFIDSANSPKKELPWDKWAHEFALNMPKEIQAEIVKNVDKSFEIEDQLELEKLGGKFSERISFQEQLNLRELVITKGEGYKKSKQTVMQVVGDRKPRGPNQKEKPKPSEHPEKRERQEKLAALRKRVKAVVDKDGKYGAEEVRVVCNLPRYRWDSNGNVFEENSKNAATWLRNDSGDGDTPDIRPTVILNPQHLFFQATVEEFKRQWPAVTHDTIEKIVRREFGHLAVVQIAHISRSFADIPEQTLDAEYFSDQALTHGLAGLIGLEALIYPKLRSLLGKPLGGSRMLANEE